jgi:hypothetical protein
LEWGYEEHKIIEDFEYFSKEESCNYRWATSRDGEYIDNAIKFFSQDEVLLVGRILKDDWFVGKVRSNYGLFYGQGYQSKIYEVLIGADSKSSEELESEETFENRTFTNFGCHASIQSSLLIIILLFVLFLLSF